MYRYSKMLITITLLTIAAPMPLPAEDTPMNDQRRQALENGEILMDLKQHPITKVYLPTGQCLVEGTVQEVWWVITDFDSFGEFLPQVVYYKPLVWQGDRLLMDCKVKVLFLKFDYRLSYIIDEENHTTYWFYVSGPIRDSQGYWRVEPYDDTRVIVTYTTTMDVGRAMPGFIEKFLAKTTFPEIFSSLKKRVKELKQQGPIKKPSLPLKPASQRAH